MKKKGIFRTSLMHFVHCIKDVRKTGLTHKGREILNGYLFISLWLIGTIAIFGRALVETIRFSFSQVILAGDEGYELVFAGLGNYHNIFLQNVDFPRLLTESLIQMLLNAPFILFFSLFVALLLNQKFKFRGLARAVFFLPVVLASPVIVGMMAEMTAMIARGGAGGAAAIPEAIGTDAMGISGFNTELLFITLFEFGIPPAVIGLVTAAIEQVFAIVNASGVQIIIFLAGLQAIPPSLYEVTKIEGATAYEAFWKITFPLISPLILTNLVYTIVDSYGRSTAFALANEMAFMRFNFGVAAAMSIATSVIILMLLFIIGYTISKHVVYLS